MTTIHFGAIKKPVPVAGAAQGGQPAPLTYYSNFPLNGWDFEKITGVDRKQVTRIGHLYDRQKQPFILTDDDLDGFTNAIRARTEIQAAVNQLDRDMRMKGLLHIPVSGPVAALHQKIEAMKLEVLETYLRQNADRIAVVPYQVQPDGMVNGWRTIGKAIRNWFSQLRKR